ncbi:MAG: glycosyltransferase family 1 protein [Candidatus Scalindua sp. AMX11]|nr:MAG: glycosyltransferase family 1 protein [Candidatus Scalindua sp.]NOG82650.1 glycosyltransferase family 4 protein [Planctomycetota bacterium]RZV95226.1 MAG: glycosyltransferase family 1 protein [Candidatus Scalindua sp. SCAELEC01]TDE66295.1 MAG: glycosyltransferase family 1 protein [Candidatus Scalindua sp. AMX11]GJQ57919.1 MAG: WabG [Candidatus Scalindua sp.]
MKIALVIYKFLPSKGGGEGYLACLANQLAERGHEVHVFAHDWENSNRLIRFHTIPAIRFPKFLKEVSFVINSRRALQAEDFDIIQVVGRALGMNVFNPHCGVERAWLKQDFQSIRNPFYRFLKRISKLFSLRQNFILWLDKKQYTDEKVSKIIAISDMIKSDMIHYHQVDPQKIAVIYNGVDTKRFNPNRRDDYRKAVRKKLSIGEEFVLLYVSNNFRLKGLATLIRSLGVLTQTQTNFKALVIGRGKKSAYGKLAKRLNCLENVLFLGQVNEIEKYYAASDLYVHPTLYDSCSLVVTEALASGLPVITTKFDGASGLIEDGKDGFVLQDPLDHKTLAGKITLFFDEERRQRASVAARNKAEQYPEEENCEKIIEVFKEVVNDAAGARRSPALS